jgi:hypothetical protein
MKQIILVLQLIAVFCFCMPSMAEDNDVVLSALVDEMDRSMKDLHIDVHPPPYFISYTVKEIDEAKYSSCLGAESLFSHSRELISVPEMSQTGCLI